MRFGKSADKVVRLVMVMALAVPLGAFGDDIERRVERLERQVQQILELLRQRSAEGEALTSPGSQAATEPLNVTGARHAEAARRGARIAYYIGSHDLGEDVPRTTQPLVAGEITFDGELSFDPAGYDISGGRFFSEYRDPSRYAEVGILLEGVINIGWAGRYEFVIYPKPAREGGSAVATTMAVRMAVDGRLISSSRPDTSWKPNRVSIELSEGKHSLRLWAVSKSPGMGPSPTASRLKLAVKGPGDAKPRALDQLYTGFDKIR